jgi:hypothetical protein
MSYALLWIETLLACLFFVAGMAAAGLRRQTRKAMIPICGIGILIPLIPLGLLVAATGALRFAVGMRHSGFTGAAALAICFLAGSAAIVVAAARRDAAGLRRALSWPLGRLAMAWTLALALMAMTLWNIDLQGQVDIQALRAEAGALAMNVIPPPIPEAENAAPLYDLFRAQFKAAATPGDAEILSRSLDGSPELAAYLQRQQKTLEVLRRAADRPGCRFEQDYSKLDFGALIPRFHSFKEGALLLRLAAITESAAGDADLALADCRRMYALAGHSQSPPALVSNLVADAIDAVASHTVVRVLPRLATRAQLDRFTAPDPLVLPEHFGRALRSEEAFGLAGLCDIADGKPDITGRVAGYGALWPLWLHEDVRSYRDLMQRMQQLAQQPYYQASAELKQVPGRAGIRRTDEGEEVVGAGYGPLTRIIVPALDSVFRNMAKEQATRTAVVVACAATRYRLDHGDYPSAAAALVPDYLAAIPADPFDGHALRWKKSGDGSVVIYSVGPDLVDDGGAIEGRDGKGPADVGVTLKLPASR